MTSDRIFEPPGPDNEAVKERRMCGECAFFATQVAAIQRKRAAPVFVPG
jgi:hypothetical protein